MVAVTAATATVASFIEYPNQGWPDNRNNGYLPKMVAKVTDRLADVRIAEAEGTAVSNEHQMNRRVMQMSYGRGCCVCAHR